MHHQCMSGCKPDDSGLLTHKKSVHNYMPSSLSYLSDIRGSDMQHYDTSLISKG